ncbi:hypothetical protein G9298_02625 [Bacillus thuringiensis]|nr:hypothetical protein G9298_02625 [Bacillus thuringiensis]
MQQFAGPNGRMFGINYGSLRIQDQWRLEVPPATPNVTYNKWIAVRNHFNAAMNDRSRIFLNHLSASPGLLSVPHQPWWPYPWFVASGYQSRPTSSPSQVARTPATNEWPDYPRDNRNRILFGGTNNLTTRRIKDGRITHTGIIAADFPGRGLIEGTIALNFPDIFNGNHQIMPIFYGDNRVFDLNVGNSRVILYNNHFGNNQRWRFEFDHTRQVYRIFSVSYPNLLLTGSDNPSVGGPHYAFAAPDRPNWVSQRWIVENGTRGG